MNNFNENIADTPNTSSNELTVDSMSDERREILVNRIGQIYTDYDKKSAHQNYGFDTTASGGENFFDISDDTEDKTPAFINTGEMAIVDNDREILTDGLMGCVACLIIGSDKKAMIHMTATNNKDGYGFWKDDGYDYDPTENTLDEIFSKIEGLNDVEDFTVCLVSGVKDTYGREQVQKLKQAIEERGVKSVKVKELPLKGTVVYHSPLNMNNLSAVGQYHNTEKTIVESLEFSIDGEDEVV